MAIKAGGVEAILNLNTAQFEQKLKTAQTDINTFASKLNKSGAMMTEMGGKLTKGLTVPLGAVAVASLNLAKNFQASMSEVRAISGATGEDMQTLEKLARDMGATTKFSATDASEGLKYMAMAGWNTQQMMSGLPPILALAAASGEDLGTTSDIVTDSLTGFGLKAEDAARFADVLAQASSSSNTNVAMMGETFKYVAPVAGALGFSIEDTALATGLLANAGIKGGQAGTVLRASLTNLVNPTDKMQAQMDRLGISVTNSDGSMKSLREIMDNLRGSMGTMTEEQKRAAIEMIAGSDAANFGAEAMAGLTDEEINYSTALSMGKDLVKDYSLEQMQSALSTQFSRKEIAAMTVEQREQEAAVIVGTAALNGLSQEQQAQAAATVFGKEAMSGMLAIVNASEEDYNNLANNIDNSAGAAERMAGIMEDNLQGSINNMKSAIEEVGISIGNILIPMVQKGAEWITEMARKFAALDDSTKETIVKFGLFLAAIGPILLIGGKLFAIFGSIVTHGGAMVGMFSTAAVAIANFGGPAQVVLIGLTKLAAIFNPVTLGLGLVAGGAILLAKHLKKDAIPEVDNFGESVSENTAKAVQAFTDLQEDANVQLKELAWGQTIITQELADDMAEKQQAMTNNLLEAITERHEKEMTAAQEQFKNITSLDQRQKDNILARIDETSTKQAAKVEEGNKKILAIQQSAADRGTKISESEAAQIQRIREDMKITAVRVMSENEAEQKIIFERMRNNASTISAKEAAEVVKNAVAKKDGVIDEAERQYAETVIWAEQQRDEAGTISEEEAKTIIAEAKRKKDMTVKEAEEMHEKIIIEAKAQAKEHVGEVDWSTGEILSKWDVLKRDGLIKLKDLKDKGVEHFKGLAEDANKWTDDMETKVAKKIKNLSEDGKEKIKDLKEKGIGFFKNLADDANKWTDDMETNVKKHIKETWSDGKEKLKDLQEKGVGHFKTLAEDANKWTDDLETNVKEHVKATWEDGKEKFKDLKEKGIEHFKNLSEDGSKWAGDLKTNATKHFKDTWTDGVKWASDLKTDVVNKYENMKTEAVKKVSDFKTDVVEWFDKTKTDVNIKVNDMVDFVKAMPGKMADGIKAGAGALKTQMVAMWNGALQAISGPVNGIIGGANWILGKFGSSVRIDPWPVPQYAKGTDGHMGGPAVVNDAKGSIYEEAIQLPDGTTFIPKGRNLLFADMPKGTKVLDAEQTKIQFYSKGIGDWGRGIIGNVISGAKNVGSKVLGAFSSIWGFMKDPASLVSKVIDSFAGDSGSGVVGSMGKGLISKVTGSMIDWVKNLFATETDPDAISEDGAGMTGGVGFPSSIFRKTSAFGYRIHPITGERKLHTGVDLAAPSGTPVYAQHGGRVTNAAYTGSYGNMIKITQGITDQVYAHLLSMAVGLGQSVLAGQFIGRVGSTGGSTGPHLHYEVRRNGAAVHPGYSRGTDYHPGGFAWVGEAGRELIDLPRGSKVFTNQQSEKMAVSNGITYGDVYVTIPAKDIKEFSDVTEFFEKLPQIAKAGVI